MERNTIQFAFPPLDKGAPATGAGANPFVAASPPTKTGFTLIELMVVVTIVAMLMVFGMPAMRTMVNSFHCDGNTRTMINSALAMARAMAAREQKYAGIRFQYAYNPRDRTDILAMPQYMIFIINEEPSNMGGLTIGFRAIEGMEPIKLPDSVGVMDLRVRMNSDEKESLPENVITDTHIDDADGLRNATTFSIVFSPSGKLIIHDVRVRNKDGKTTNTSHDDIFNTQNNVENNNGRGMFYQDDYANLGLGQEMSRNSFIIFDANILKNINVNDRWDDYLKDLPASHINPYTGSIINNK